MKIFNYVFLLSFFATSFSFAQEWNLVFSDEFDSNGAVDSEKWFHQTQLPNGWGWYNNEQQHYTNRIENSYVENGILKIVAKKENFTDQGHTKPYSSARLNSKFAFQYGKVEVRAKLPSGGGTWPAIWTLGKNITEPGAYFTESHGTTAWPACGEIDIMEHWGNNQNYVQSATHTPSSYGGTINHGGQMIYTASSQMHTYGLVWTPEKLVFSVDGVEHYTYNPPAKNAETWPFDAEQFLLLNFAIADDIDPSFTQGAMEIDYVRVYQPGNGDYTTDVTFQVDMSNEEVNPDGVYLAGGDFGQDGYLMTNQGNDLWAVTIPVEPNTSYNYKFRNQPSYGTWDGFESDAGILTGGCSSGNAYNDRLVNVGENDMTLNVVTYGGCTDERDSGNNNNDNNTGNDNPPTDVISIFSNDYDNIANVEFNPNWGQSTDVTVGDELVYTNLNYQGTSFDSQDVSDYDYFHLDYYTDNSTELNVYVISLDPTRDGDSYSVDLEYGQWNSIKIPLTAYPSVDLANVQQLKVDGNGTVRLKNLYFGSNTSAIVSGCTDSNANNYNPTATLSDGSCNYDTPNCEIAVRHLNLENQPDSEILLTISKLSSNALSISAESSNEDVLDKFFIGAQNAPVAEVLSTTIEGGKANLTLVWSGSVPEVGTFEILWSKESTGGNWMLTKEQSSEISLTGTCTEDPNGTPGCTDSNANNYNANATEDDNSCTYENGLVNVTFQVDMSNETVHPEGVYLAGGGFGQQGYLMNDIGNDIWSISIGLDPNQTYLYKFRNQPSFGTWEGFESDAGLVNCGTGQYTDRYINLGSTNTILPVVAYGSCTGNNPGGSGCMDPNATNYNPNATTAGLDAEGNSICTYDVCNTCAYDEVCINDVCEKVAPVETLLPKVYIDTENQATIKQKTEGYINGLVTVVGGTSIKSGAAIQGLDSLVMEIRGRGNSTWYFHPKKPYQMKLAEKAKFLDMPNDKKWLFLAEYSDKTMLRNTMALEMGYGSSLDWTPEGEFAEVYINGEYNGTYNITQKVEEKSNRVDIGDNGYLMEIDQPERLDADDHYVSSGSFPVIAFKAPDINDIIEESGLEAANETKNRISTFVNDFESALYGSNFGDPTSGYAKYIDVESFIDWFLINEITKNVDARNFSSIYFNVVLDENNEGKIKMGPLWDFDLSFGNNNYSDSEFPERWWIKENAWIARLMQDPAFEKQVKIKFHDHYYAKKDSILNLITTYAEALKPSAVQNDQRWSPYLGTQAWPNAYQGDIATGNTGLAGYNDAVGYMKQWYSTRMEWLKDNLPSVEGCMDSNANNYVDAATVQPVDENGNVLCTYLTCADVPVNGCKYSNSFAAWNEYFTSENCVTYGGSPCNEIQITGCTDATANNYDFNATVDDDSCVFPSGAPACVLGTIYLTEAHGSGDPEDYIEIYNSGSEDCTLLGFTFDDEQPFDDLTFGDVVISADDYLVFYEDAENSFSSGIGSGGDKLYLGDAEGNVSMFESLAGDLGATNFTADGTRCAAEPTPGALNSACIDYVEGCTDPTASNYNPDAVINKNCEYTTEDPACVLGTVYITEAHGKGDPKDYIEIYNSGNTDCSLLGFMLDDEQPFGDLTFGDVVISAGAYWVGEEDAEGSFGSGIGGGGDSLYLGDAQGNVLVVASLDGDLGGTSFTADGNGCSAVPSPGLANNACTVFIEGCTDPTASNYNSEANLEDDSCDYESCNPEWQEIVTNQNHSIFINGPWTDVDGNPIGEGAILGVFYEDDNGTIKSAGWTEYVAGTVQIAAMGDDDSTSEKDGLSAGESLSYRIWDPTSCQEYQASITYTSGPETFVANGITFINSVTAVLAGPNVQEINIVKGWSIISTYMIPDDMDLMNVVAPIVEHIIIVKDFSGKAYLPEYNFNGIGNIEVGQGYQIKTTEETEISISGAYAYPEEHSINYLQGWNMIGYLRTEAAAADLVMSDMVANEKLIIAKNSTGQAFLPEYNFNGIGTMNPGEGYQIKTTASGTHQYLSNDFTYEESQLKVSKDDPYYFDEVASTGENMTVIIEDAAWNTPLTVGSEVAAFDQKGDLVGSAVYSSPVTVLSLWGDDATTSTKDGLSAMELAKFKVWDAEGVKELEVKNWTKGSSTYRKNSINVATSIDTFIELNAPTTKALVKVVNILGQEVSLDEVSSVRSIFFNIYDDGSVEKVVK
jgi:beta-glucanase (GH16 family)